MEKGYTHGKMEEAIKDSTNMTKNMDSEYMFGLMAEVKYQH